jgi:hypothetical protein
MNEAILKRVTFAAEHAKLPACAGVLNALAESIRAHDDELGTELETAYRDAADNIANLDTLLAVAAPTDAIFALRKRQVAAVGDVLARLFRRAAPEIAAETDSIELWCEATRNRISAREAENARRTESARISSIQAEAEKMSPGEIVIAAEKTGVRLELDGTAIRIQPAGRLSADHVARINYRRAAVVQFLSERQATQTI